MEKYLGPKMKNIEAVSWPLGMAVSKPYRGRIEAVSWPYCGRIVTV